VHSGPSWQLRNVWWNGGELDSDDEWPNLQFIAVLKLSEVLHRTPVTTDRSPREWVNVPPSCVRCEESMDAGKPRVGEPDVADRKSAE
jgi:hypothetical protein